MIGRRRLQSEAYTILAEEGPRIKLTQHNDEAVKV